MHRDMGAQRTGRTLRLSRLRRVVSEGRGGSPAEAAAAGPAPRGTQPKVVALAAAWACPPRSPRCAGSPATHRRRHRRGDRRLQRRLRDELGVLPPGDLRKALAALCGDATGARPGHGSSSTVSSPRAICTSTPVGNLLIVALWEQWGHVQALDLVGRLLGAHGRVLPMFRRTPGAPGARQGTRQAPDEIGTVRGQANVALTPGEVQSVHLVPNDRRRARGGRRGAGRRLGRAGPGLLVLLGDPASARPRSWTHSRDQGAPDTLLEPRSAARRDSGLLPAASFGGFGTTRP